MLFPLRNLEKYLIAPSNAMHETIACEAMLRSVKSQLAAEKDKSDAIMYDKLKPVFGTGVLVQSCALTVGLTYVTPVHTGCCGGRTMSDARLVYRYLDLFLNTLAFTSFGRT